MRVQKVEGPIESAAVNQPKVPGWFSVHYNPRLKSSSNHHLHSNSNAASQSMRKANATEGDPNAKVKAGPK